METARRSNQYAKRRGVPGHVTLDDVLAMWKRNPQCIGCGVGRGIDHIVAFSDGGTHDASNIQTMCQSCNSRKGIATMPRVNGHLVSKGNKDAYS